MYGFDSHFLPLGSRKSGGKLPHSKGMGTCALRRQQARDFAKGKCAIQENGVPDNA